MKQKIIEVYQETGNFYKAQEAGGLSAHLTHLILAQAGILKIKDKIKFGGGNAKKGGEAEELFQKLVPDAIDANRCWQTNNPIFDFSYKGLTIDVKYSGWKPAKYDSKGKKRASYWSMRTGRADMYVLFMENDQNPSGLENCYILAIPGSFIDQKSNLSISKTGAYFKEFMVSEESLQEVVSLYAELKADGMD